MSVARITEISATSEKGFEDAIQQGLDRATKTLRGVSGAWVKEQQIKLSDGKVTGIRSTCWSPSCWKTRFDTSPPSDGAFWKV